MAIVRWDPYAGLTSLHSQLDDMFNNLFSSASRNHGAPATDVYTEDDKALVAEVHAPGFSQSDVEVNIHNNILEIKGEKHEKEEDKDKKRSYMVRESSTSFYRSIALPKHADADNVEASFDNGVLKIRVPFKELPTPKRIAINSGKQK